MEGERKRGRNREGVIGKVEREREIGNSGEEELSEEGEEEMEI